MQVEQVIAFPTETEPPGLEIRVNFGVFAGRAATPAEVDELAKLLVPEVGDVSLVAEERREVGPGTEIALHQVRVEIAADRLPSDGAELDSLREKLVTLTEIWARACIAERSLDLSDL